MASQSKSWSWRHAILKSDLGPTTRHVLLTISCYMNDVGGGCYPTTRELASATGLSERAVCEHIGKAVTAGWLKVSEHGFRGQRWKNHEYRAAWPDNAEGTERPSVPLEQKSRSPSRKGADRESAASSEKALTVVPKGTDPDDKKALTDGQSNSPEYFPGKVIIGRARKHAQPCDPVHELRKALDEDRARAVVDHRTRMRKPLTGYAATLLAKKFAQCSDPNAGADAMIANGWQGFDPAWLERDRPRGVMVASPKPRSVVDAARARLLELEAGGHDAG